MKQQAISEDMMHNEELLHKKEWVQCWQRAGVELERLRRAELPLVSTTQALENLSGAFEFARCH